MSIDWPIDVPNDDWSHYSFWRVTFTTRQGLTTSAVIFALSANDAIAGITDHCINQDLYGPLTNVSAAATNGPGF